jgi:hypothetical protein
VRTAEAEQPLAEHLRGRTRQRQTTIAYLISSRDFKFYFLKKLKLLLRI